MKHSKWLGILAIVFVLSSLLMGAAPAAADPPDDIPRPDAPPPGLALKVFIHYPKGHGPGTDVVSAPVCSDPSPATCADYAIATTSGGLPIRWQDPTGGGTGIPYYTTLNYSTRKSRSLSASAATAAIDASFATWEAASDAGLNYTDKGLAGRVTIPRLDGRNVVGWKALKSTAIAVTYVWYYTATGYLAEFDMAFNDNYSWTYTPPTGIDPAIAYDDPDNTGVANTFDLRNIGTHEAGHTLMLNDLYDASQANLTMYGYGSYAELKKDTLARGDEQGVKAAY